MRGLSALLWIWVWILLATPCLYSGETLGLVISLPALASMTLSALVVRKSLNYLLARPSAFYSTCRQSTVALVGLNMLLRLALIWLSERFDCTS